VRGRLTRRRLLAIPLLVALCSPLGRILTQAAAPDRLADIYARLDERIGLKVADLGEAFLRHSPAEASQLRLAELIESMHGECLRPALDGGELVMQSALREVYRRDFESGRVICVGGWVVSLTEAWLHAWRHLAKV
jgi:hypothetical protein